MLGPKAHKGNSKNPQKQPNVEVIKIKLRNNRNNNNRKNCRRLSWKNLLKEDFRLRGIEGAPESGLSINPAS